MLGSLLRQSSKISAGITEANRRLRELARFKDELIAKHPDLAADVFNAFAESKRLYVDRQWHGRGIAQALMTHAIGAAQVRGARPRVAQPREHLDEDPDTRSAGSERDAP